MRAPVQVAKKVAPKNPGPTNKKQKAQDRVRWRNVWMTARMRDQFIAAEKILLKKFPNAPKLSFSKGSWMPYSRLSGPTHNGAGVADLRDSPYNTAQRKYLDKAMKDVGLYPYYREAGWDGSADNSHWHVLDQVTTGMNASAKRQVASYKAGRNGLNNNAPDRSYRPKTPVIWKYLLGRAVPV